MFNVFKTKCPKCDSTNLKLVKESFMNHFNRSLLNVAFPIRFIIGSGRAPHSMYVCRDCGMNWAKI